MPRKTYGINILKTKKNILTLQPEWQPGVKIEQSNIINLKY